MPSWKIGLSIDDKDKMADEIYEKVKHLFDDSVNKLDKKLTELEEIAGPLEGFYDKKIDKTSYNKAADRKAEIKNENAYISINSGDYNPDDDGGKHSEFEMTEKKMALSSYESEDSGIHEKKGRLEIISDKVTIEAMTESGRKTEKIEVTPKGTAIDNLVVNNDLIVKGKTTSKEIEEVSTPMQTIELAKGNTTPIVGFSGFLIKNYDGEHDMGLFVDNKGVAYVGDCIVNDDGTVTQIGDMQPLATRVESGLLTDKELLIWDNIKSQLVGSGILLNNLLTLGNNLSKNTDKEPISIGYIDEDGNTNGISIKEKFNLISKTTEKANGYGNIFQVIQNGFTDNSSGAKLVEQTTPIQDKKNILNYNSTTNDGSSSTVPIPREEATSIINNIEITGSKVARNMTSAKSREGNTIYEFGVSQYNYKGTDNLYYSMPYIIQNTYSNGNRITHYGQSNESIGFYTYNEDGSKNAMVELINPNIESGTGGKGDGQTLRLYSKKGFALTDENRNVKHIITYDEDVCIDDEKIVTSNDLDTTLDEINTLLGNKLDKITTTTVNGQAYTKNIYGGQSMIDLTNNAIGNTIVWRNGNGRAKVAAPVDSLDIANKSYVDTNIASLDTRLTDLEGTVFYPIESEDTFISRTTAEGTNVVNDSTMEIESIEGASEVSENLIIIEDKDATTVNGVTYSIRDGVITLNGTASATSHTSITNATIKMNNATTYHYTMFNSNNGFSSNGVACYIQLYDGSSYKNYGNESTGTSLTTPDEINSKVLILSIASGTTFSNTKLKPMLVKGSTAPTEFSQGYSGIKHAYIGDFVSVDKNGETQTSLTLNQELPKGYVLTKEGLTKKWGSVTYSEDFENELIASGTNYIVDNEKTTIEYELATPTTDTTIKLPTTNTIKSYHNGTEYFTDTELPLTLNAIYRATNIEQED